MMRRVIFVGIVLALSSAGYGTFRLVQRSREAKGTSVAQVATPDPSKDPVYVCPMDPDIRSNDPGNCVRCGMALVAGVPDQVDFHIDFSVDPQAPQVQQ